MSSHNKDFLKMTFTAFLRGAEHKRDSVLKMLASSGLLSVGKAHKRDSSIFMKPTGDWVKF